MSRKLFKDSKSGNEKRLLNKNLTILEKDFYQQDTRLVAINLLGKYLVHQLNNQTLIGKIVETEAYLGELDPACHFFTGPSNRNAIFFEPPGTCYVYLIYGIHHCLNVITQPPNYKGAVLIRALEPVTGSDTMIRNRHGSSIKELSNGPGKLTQAFQITMKHNYRSLCSGELTIQSDDYSIEKSIIGVSSRIGISKAIAWKLRYFLINNSFVSGPKTISFSCLSDIPNLPAINTYKV